MAEQIMTLEKTFILKLETLLTQRMLALVNSKTNHIDRVYDGLQKKDIKLQRQAQDLTRELWSTVLDITLPLEMDIDTNGPPSTNDSRPISNCSSTWTANTQTTRIGNIGTEPKDSATNKPLSAKTSPGTNLIPCKYETSLIPICSEHGDSSSSSSIRLTGTDIVHCQ